MYVSFHCSIRKFSNVFFSSVRECVSLCVLHRFLYGKMVDEGGEISATIRGDFEHSSDHQGSAGTSTSWLLCAVEYAALLKREICRQCEAYNKRCGLWNRSAPFHLAAFPDTFFQLWLLSKSAPERMCFGSFHNRDQGLKTVAFVQRTNEGGGMIFSRDR